MSKEKAMASLEEVPTPTLIEAAQKRLANKTMTFEKKLTYDGVAAIVAICAAVIYVVTTHIDVGYTKQQQARDEEAIKENASNIQQVSRDTAASIQELKTECSLLRENLAVLTALQKVQSPSTTINNK